MLIPRLDWATEKPSIRPLHPLGLSEPAAGWCCVHLGILAVQWTWEAWFDSSDPKVGLITVGVLVNFTALDKALLFTTCGDD